MDARSWKHRGSVVGPAVLDKLRVLGPYKCGWLDYLSDSKLWPWRRGQDNELSMVINRLDRASVFVGTWKARPGGSTPQEQGASSHHEAVQPPGVDETSHSLGGGSNSTALPAN